MRRSFHLAAVVFVVALLAGTSCRKAIPLNERLGVISGSSITVIVPVRPEPPYQLILGYPAPAHSVPPADFRGVVTVRQGPRTLGTFPVSLASSQSCNWLVDSETPVGLILTWRVTDHGRRFSQVLKPWHRYNIDLSFTLPPPPGTALWFSSMVRGTPFRNATLSGRGPR